MILLLVAAGLGFGLYTPWNGSLSFGDDQAVAQQVPRNRVEVAVEGVMAAAPGKRPTLADVVGFFGLESSTIACTVQANEDDVAVDPRLVERLARRPLAVGQKVVLCLD